jgi:hypothetical protein
MKSVLSGVMLALALAMPLAAAPVARIVVSDAWIRALPGDLPAGGYFTLHNRTSKAVTLSGAASSACGMLMLHKSDSMGGMASMSDVSRIDVPAGGTLSFSPGGYHLMCMDPGPAIRRGNTITVELDFTDGTKTAAAFVVRGANGH